MAEAHGTWNTEHRQEHGTIPTGRTCIVLLDFRLSTFAFPAFLSLDISELPNPDTPKEPAKARNCLRHLSIPWYCVLCARSHVLAEYRGAVFGCTLIRPLARWARVASHVLETHMPQRAQLHTLLDRFQTPGPGTLMAVLRIYREMLRMCPLRCNCDDTIERASPRSNPHLNPPLPPWIPPAGCMRHPCLVDGRSEIGTRDDGATERHKPPGANPCSRPQTSSTPSNSLHSLAFSPRFPATCIWSISGPAH